MKFKGYRRPDGRFGVRNHVLVLPTVSCADKVVYALKSVLPEVVAVPHPYGCTFDVEELGRFCEVLVGFGAHPNVRAVVLVSLGCETTPVQEVYERIRASGKPVEVVEVQKEGGVREALEGALKHARRFLHEAEADVREEAPLSELTVALECGGSDAYSGISANPALGEFSDMLVAEGGTVILSETSELVGAEHVLARRAASPDVRKALLEVVRRAERELALSSPDGLYLAPGNVEGGLTTIEEKSLGCAYKAGSSRIIEVVEYARRPSKKGGVVVMDTPGYDVASITGMVAGGAQVVVFTTGRGTPTGCPIAPVVKVCSNTPTFLRLSEDMDINAGTVVDGKESIREVGERIFREVLRVASGGRTKSEDWPYQEFAVARTSLVEKGVLCGAIGA